MSTTISDKYSGNLKCKRFDTSKAPGEINLKTKADVDSILMIKIIFWHNYLLLIIFIKDDQAATVGIKNWALLIHVTLIVH